MIPKVIDYVWVGGKPLNKLAKKCIKSWKKFCPDYEIKRWDETNFDVTKNKYCKEAYEAKKWAFVSDYIRISVLYDEGGIYLDTDVELVKSLDDLLDSPAVTGFEKKSFITTGVIAAEKNNKWVKSFLDLYNEKSFIKADGSFDLTTNVELVTNLVKEKYKIKFDDTQQDLKDFVVYPTEYFCPLQDENLVMTNNTYAIHWFNGSWLPHTKSSGFKKFIKSILPKKFVKYIQNKRKKN